MKVEITEIAKLSLKPGDALLVKLPANTSRDAFAGIKRLLMGAFDGFERNFPIIFTTDQIEFSVVEAPKETK